MAPRFLAEHVCHNVLIPLNFFSNRLLELKASNLRGLPADWPEVQIGERGLVVYGPNGTGKSSIIDGIEYVLTGNSTLYAQPRQGVNWAAGAPHVRGGRMSATLTVQD